MDEQRNNDELNSAPKETATDTTQPMPTGKPVEIDETQPMPAADQASPQPTVQTAEQQPAPQPAAQPSAQTTAAYPPPSGTAGNYNVPQAGAQQYPQANQPSPTGALVCGILAIVLCGIPIVGIILGIIAIVLAGKYFKAGGADGKGKAGRICGIIGIVLSAIMAIASFFLTMTLLQAIDESDVDAYVYESITSSSSAAVDTSRQSDFTAEEQELIDVTDVQMAKLKNQDPEMVATVARIIEDSLNDELDDIDVTFAQLGLNSTDIAKSMLKGFDYTPAFASVYSGEGTVSYDVTVKDINMVASAFTSNVYDLMDSLDASTTTAEGYKMIGQALMDAVNQTDPSTDGYMSIELAQGPNGWTIDAESWNDNLEYLFEF